MQARLLEFVSERTGKPVDSGFTLERYVGLERERFADVKDRVAKTSAWDFVTAWDKFAAIGDRWGLRNCAQKEQVERRKTFLSVLDLPPAESVP